MNDNIIKMPSDTGAFLEIKCNNGNVIYGGDQAMFAEERYRKLGCGIISAANIMVYLSACGRYHFTPKGEFSLAADDYMNFAEKLTKRFPPDVNGLRWMRIYKKLTGDGARYFPLFSTPAEYLFRIIEKSLKADCPLMISVYDRKGSEMFPYSPDKGLSDSGRELVHAHYMTVTGLDIKNGKRLIIVSSWGRRYAFDFDRYCRENRHILYKSRGNGIGSGIFEVNMRGVTDKKQGI